MLRLRPYKNCDAQYIAGWIKDEAAFRRWCADRFETYPVSAEDINRHYAACAEADNFYEMTAFDDSGVVGHLIMRFTDEAKTVLRFGFVIVDDTSYSSASHAADHLLRRLDAASHHLSVADVRFAHLRK